MPLQLPGRRLADNERLFISDPFAGSEAISIALLTRVGNIEHYETITSISIKEALLDDARARTRQAFEEELLTAGV